VENTAEDIISSEKFQGTPEPGSSVGIFAFYSPLRIVRRGPEIVKPDRPGAKFRELSQINFAIILTGLKALLLFFIEGIWP
jgi:hypothetical protein